MDKQIVHVDQSEETIKRGKKRNKELNSGIEPIINDPRGYSVEKISDMSIFLHEFTALSREKNTIWTFAEADLTEALKKIKEHKTKTGDSISLTAFLITVFARVIACHKYPMNSCKKGKHEIYTFNDVDFSTNIERTFPDGSKRPVSHTIRKANEKTLREISDELNSAKISRQSTASNTKGKKGFVKWAIKRIHKMPGWIRRALIRRMAFKDPVLKKKSMGTVNLTAVGMNGTGMGKMVHITPHALSIGIGGIEELPFTIDGAVYSRQLVGITLAMDHDVIDGAPAARFFHDVRQWLMYFCHDQDWCFKSLEQPSTFKREESPKTE